MPALNCANAAFVRPPPATALCGNFAPVTRTPAAKPCQRHGPISTADEDTIDQFGADLWVFAYGSLMWRLGFSALERRYARLVAPTGRSASIPSSTAERLKSPAWCSASTAAAIAAVSPTGWRTTSAPKRLPICAREQVTFVYRGSWRTVWLDDDQQQGMHARSAAWAIAATGNMPDACHWRIAFRAAWLRVLRQQSRYVLAAVKEIETQGYRDKPLHLLASCSGARTKLIKMLCLQRVAAPSLLR